MGNDHTRRKLGNLKTDPALLALLEKAKDHVMTPEEIRAQRRSWVRGELMLKNPEMTLEEANSLIRDGEILRGEP